MKEDKILEAYEKILNEGFTGKDIEKAISNIDSGIDLILKYFKKEEKEKYKEFKKVSDDFIIFLENSGLY